MKILFLKSLFFMLIASSCAFAQDNPPGDPDTTPKAKITEMTSSPIRDLNGRVLATTVEATARIDDAKGSKPFSLYIDREAASLDLVTGTGVINGSGDVDAWPVMPDGRIQAKLIVPVEVRDVHDAQQNRQIVWDLVFVEPSSLSATLGRLNPRYDTDPAILEFPVYFHNVDLEFGAVIRVYSLPKNVALSPESETEIGTMVVDKDCSGLRTISKTFASNIIQDDIQALYDFMHSHDFYVSITSLRPSNEGPGNTGQQGGN